MSSAFEDCTEYLVDIKVNEISINTVIIAQHYKKRHSESISDPLILKLVNMLDNREFNSEDHDDNFRYFKTFLVLNERRYKLVWTLESDKFYVGVVNAHRSEQKEN